VLGHVIYIILHKNAHNYQISLQLNNLSSAFTNDKNQPAESFGPIKLRTTLRYQSMPITLKLKYINLWLFALN